MHTSQKGCNLRPPLRYIPPTSQKFKCCFSPVTVYLLYEHYHISKTIKFLSQCVCVYYYIYILMPSSPFLPSLLLVFIMGFGLLVYPFGLGSTAVQRHCENSSIYYAGDCQIGWGYMLAIVGVMLSVFLPFFAKYAPKEHASPTPIPTIL
uniref:Transmembrane protein 211 n=1 Tax=Podarcis muralis TaxID=64176 RepID=A0A670KL67_PODMU